MKLQYEKRPVNIQGWEMYQVDTEGNVFGKTGNKLYYSINHNGYCIVVFYKRPNIIKGFGIHTLVAKTFVEGETKERYQVNHKDGNKQNNCVENLEWVTPKENTQHAIQVLGHSKFSYNNPNAKCVCGYDKKTGEKVYEFPSVADAARFFTKPNQSYRGIQNIISQIALGHSRKKSYRGCIWVYE